jgi:hypothetical protein
MVVKALESTQELVEASDSETKHCVLLYHGSVEFKILIQDKFPPENCLT